MGRGLEARLDPALMAEVQIFPSRVDAELDPTKVRLLWCHDMPEDPMYDHLKNGGWRRFHRIVFVSNWQMQGFIARFGIPWSRCLVLQNAIDPVKAESPGLFDDPPKNVRLIYTPTPHRGLNILLGAFGKVAETDKDVHLDVFSSFGLYGWPDQDKNFQLIFDKLDEHPQITRHGTVPNEEVRKALAESHVFAYPSTWPETSCRCLIEAMSAGLICVHSNLAALPETAANWTFMYQYQDDPGRHAAVLVDALRAAIDKVRAGDGFQASQKAYADLFYTWDFRVQEWTGLVSSLLHEDRAIEDGPQFVYRTA
jgi:glycosyltransferase involved in cell wall biosynthesis